MRVERERFPAGYVYVDGTDIGGADTVIRDRRHLADDGVLIVTIGIDFSHRVRSSSVPTSTRHGVTADEDEDMHAMILERVVEQSVAGFDTHRP